jgi:hypothetical protein
VTVTKTINNTVVVDDRITALTSGAVESYEHTQSSVSDVWVVNHTLGFNPAVTVLNNSGEVVHGEVQYTGEQQVTIRFTAPFTGKVYLS